MLVKMRSPFTQQENTMEIDITPTQLAEWRGGSGLIQDEFPNLSAEQREFLISGITPEDWKQMMDN